ncbi:MAG: B12-binding domain-containing radical SAM protein [Proteobacteria bacterium]|nr:B12-binding domain-containing radical SAM protein [Pseudomonadota bacterium]MBU1585586.1 B12-binding domain-containing radical SAM protein [Pseudomonadota bacterium]MBU2452276.1 B12-binding domain-containing radical SAM protein [Pseudomonadota bacterium]MBU2628560.1 B12-binding domain-containing radical SAM protein [Pseudomonadota bacterium]
MKKRFKPARDNDLKKIKEQGAIIKKGKGLIKAALVYPNTYEAGMSSLGFQTVYKIANQSEFVACERFFLPDPKQKVRRPKSLESGLSLDQFDIILFSVSFENDFNHLVPLLGEAGIPLRSPDRNHTHPLVVAGGVACFLNPEPIAPFIDCFLLGEAECLLGPFFDSLSKKPDKKLFLQTLEKKIPGAYVPALHTDKTAFQINVQYLENLDTITTFTTILSSGTAFKDIFLIETLKGCPHGCRFCSAGFVYRPPRIYPVKNIYAAIDRAVDKTNKIGLVSSAIADHPDITQICNYGLTHNFKLSFSSLRADKLTDELVRTLSNSNIKTATIAPEAGSTRMRNIINKKISENDILCATHRLITAGIINLRLYFMIGLPFELDQDVHEIVALTKKIKTVFLEVSKKKKKIGTITLSINPFIPKPCTPFQWAAMADETTLKHRVGIIKQGLKTMANVTVNFESLRIAKIHALLSRGDQKTAEIIEYAQNKGWSSAMKRYKTYCDAVIYQEKSFDSPLPWDFLDNRIKKEFLAKEFVKAKQEKNSPSCPMIDCSTCNTCI